VEAYELLYVNDSITNIWPTIDEENFIVCTMNGGYGRYCIAPIYFDLLSLAGENMESFL